MNQDDSQDRKKIIIFLIFLFFRIFLLHLFLVIFFLVVCQEQCFCSILTGTFFMKSYAGNWQINRDSRNRMSKKILSERIPLNGQWNNRTSRTWPETRHGRDGRSRSSFLLTKLAKSNDRAILDNRSWNSRVFIRPAVILPDLSDGISFSLYQ